MEFGDCISQAVRVVPLYEGELPIEAVVIAKQESDYILFVEAKKNEHNERAYFRLTPNSKNTLGEKEIVIRDVIKVLKVKKLHQPEEDTDCRLDPFFEVVGYEFAGTEQTPSLCQIIGIYKVEKGVIFVTGTSFLEEFGMYSYDEIKESEYESNQFAMATCYSLGDLKPIARHQPRNGKSYPYYAQHYGPLHQENREIPPQYLIHSLRHLRKEELTWISDRLASKEERSLTDAQLYIRDPHVAAILLEEANQEDSVQDATISKFVTSIKVARDELTGANDVCVLAFNLTSEEYDRLFKTDGIHQWREGAILTVSHPSLISDRRAKLPEMKIKKVINTTNDMKEVLLFPLPRSKEQMKIVIANHREFFKWQFLITPEAHFSKAVVIAILEGFDEFFEDRHHLFELFGGWRETPDNIEIPDKDEPFYVKGDPLDPHQLHFMKSAAYNPGWTCGQAPPGCGKTHTTAALVGYLNEKRFEDGICISGTTNAAVSNAADAVHLNFPDIPTIRNYSRKAETEIDDKSKEISLSEMAQNCSKHLTREDAPKVYEVREDYQITADAYVRQSYKNSAQQVRAFTRVEKKRNMVDEVFIQHYNMKIYATTVELLILKGDKFCSQLIRGTEEYANKATKRIVLDEAAQLSPVEALALYCKLPNLTHITLLGDTYQLGPHSRLPVGSMAHSLLSQGELTRMYALKSTVKRSLNGLYRCHPQIAEKILLPIYGNKMECMKTAEDRSMAADLNLPRCSDGTPFCAFHIAAAEHKGENREEAMHVMKFVNYLCLEKKVQDKHIVILTFHRVQRDIIRQELTNDMDKMRYNWKPLLQVETVDSFQGKEAEVIILSTSKSTHLRKEDADRVAAKLQFIGDPQRATVAVSRAQHAFYIIGDLFLLTQSPFYAKILKRLVLVEGICLTMNYRPMTGNLLDKVRRNIFRALPYSEEQKAAINKKNQEEMEAERRKEERRKKKMLAKREKMMNEKNEKEQNDAAAEKVKEESGENNAEVVSSEEPTVISSDPPPTAEDEKSAENSEKGAVEECCCVEITELTEEYKKLLNFN